MKSNLLGYLLRKQGEYAIGMRSQMSPQIQQICWVNSCDLMQGQETMQDRHKGYGYEEMEKRKRRLRPFVNMCEGLDVKKLTKDNPYENYGNCVICMGRGIAGSLCLRDGCKTSAISQIVCFQNFNKKYINPELIDKIFKKAQTKEVVPGKNMHYIKDR